MRSVRGEISVVVGQDWPAEVIELWRRIDPRVVVVPGGRTPAPLFRALLAVAAELRLDRAEFFFSDERCVPPSHRDSNFGSAYRILFAHIRTTVHRMPSESCTPEGYSSTLERRRIDLALLGIGEDGHTASLFEGSAACEATGPAAPLVTTVDRPDCRRLTLTPRALNGSSVIAFLASGKTKAGVVAALSRRDPSIVASAMAGREATYLFCDPEAASALNL